MSELRRDLIFIGVTFLTISVVATASFFAFRGDEQRRKQLTAEVPATIVELYERRDINPETGAPTGIVNVLVSYTYKVNGREYTRKVIVGRDVGKTFAVGQPAKVCYKPENQDQAELFPSAHTCGGE